jgi:hypothetical protein
MIRRRTVLLALVVSAALPGRAAFSQSHPVELWVRSGVFQPSDESLAEVYPGARFPFVAQGEVRVRSAVAVFGGLRYAMMDGDAVAEGGANGAALGTATRLTSTAARVGALVVLQRGRHWDIRLGGGVTVTSYSEDWSGADANSVSGTKAGWLLEAAVSRRLGRHWFLGGSVEYSGVHVPAGGGENPTFEANLGGLDLLAGVGFRF